MKKSNGIYCIYVIVGIVLSTVILLTVYRYSFCGLLKELLIATFTGCLFAIPSGIVIIGADIKHIRREKAEILSNLYANFANISIKDYGCYNFGDMEHIRINIVSLYYMLKRVIYENCLIKKEKMVELSIEIFNCSRIILKLNNDYEEKKRREFNKDVNDINKSKCLCLKLIQEIQEEK